MFLLINLAEKEFIHLAIFDEKHYHEKKYHGQNRELLICIDDILKTPASVPTKSGLRRGKVKGIMCVVGAGGFTSARIAAVVANTLAYTLQIPVLAIFSPPLYKGGKKGGYLKQLIPRLLKQPIRQYISPTYSGEPNIGKKN